MNTFNSSEAERLVRYSRRGMWIVLIMILLIGAGGAAQLGFPGSRAAVIAHSMSMLLPIVIVIAAASLKSAAKGARTDPDGPAMKAMLNDELRQDSLKRSFRNGFFCVLFMQPLLMAAPAWIAIEHPASFMGCVTLAAGAAVTLASLLWYDR